METLSQPFLPRGRGNALYYFEVWIVWMPKSLNPNLGKKLTEYSGVNKGFDPTSATFFVGGTKPNAYHAIRDQ
ncbi:MAG: hypothetical protein WBE58_06725 [Verrucomicrobiales bacterium]|nr:hypothetical protein [Verrucomicrobiales bacterium]